MFLKNFILNASMHLDIFKTKRLHVGIFNVKETLFYLTIFINSLIDLEQIAYPF